MNSGLTELLTQDDEENEDSEKLDDDAFLIYGPSIFSYFLLQKSLIKAFAFLTLLAMIQMIIFNFQGGLDFIRESVSMTAQYSFGNMGFSSSQCSKSIINWDK